ncbi:zf-RING_2 domain-containing protein [Cephalotus follicularis]|uniref:RING-type E3 ubiquitin transferase n=1 Tax=Cephalotus follicularis TaxID=3775 RepID=A0A1Q3B496_CEPFO|nr:zf-RING_2 domain-containing protein [Cephalotus follicularis]
MSESDNNLSFVFLLLLSAYYLANAQSSTESPQASHSTYRDLSSSIAVILMTLICFVLVFGFLNLYFRRCAPAADADTPFTSGEQSLRRGLDPVVIQAFPVFVYSAVKEIKIGRGAIECAVCLSEFEDDHTMRLLPRCEHVFHPGCIDAWLASHDTCPVCRANLTQETSEIAKETEIGESNAEPNQENDSSGENEIAIIVDEVSQKESYRRARITGRFPRSNSTGHCTERYTLRLPEEMRKQAIAKARLKRTESFHVVLASEGSMSKGEKSSWVFSMTPPFVSRFESVKSTKIGSASDVR